MVLTYLKKGQEILKKVSLLLTILKWSLGKRMTWLVTLITYLNLTILLVFKNSQAANVLTFICFISSNICSGGRLATALLMDSGASCG